LSALVVTITITLLVSKYIGVQRQLEVPLNNHDEVLKIAYKRFSKQIDQSGRKFKPSLGEGSSTSGSVTSSFAILAIGVTNIPLMFELFTSSRNNVMFLAAPVLLGTCIYVNITSAGPQLLNCILIRKIEKHQGFRFINADFEKIQELRRSFFLARWLMKDYVKPVSK
jgi:hypothetical protein